MENNTISFFGNIHGGGSTSSSSYAVQGYRSSDTMWTSNFSNFTYSQTINWSSYNNVVGQGNVVGYPSTPIERPNDNKGRFKIWTSDAPLTIFWLDSNRKYNPENYMVIYWKDINSANGPTIIAMGNNAKYVSNGIQLDDAFIYGHLYASNTDMSWECNLFCVKTMNWNGYQY